MSREINRSTDGWLQGQGEPVHEVADAFPRSGDIGCYDQDRTARVRRSVDKVVHDFGVAAYVQLEPCFRGGRDYFFD